MMKLSVIQPNLTELPVGTHQLTIEAARYYIYQQEIDIIGMDQLQTITPALIPAWAQVKLKPPLAHRFIAI